ncbi:MAG: M1 family aminopeptidase, partial [Vicinamibacterales bacterium]
YQSGSGGMEYPTLFTAGARWIAPERITQPESVTIHEAGHQFWYGIVASNEFEHAWLDEGLTTFSTTRVLAEAFDPNYAVQRYFGGFIPWVFRDLPLSRQTETMALARFRAAGRTDVPSTPTWQYWPGNHWGPTYFKTALWLHTLERMLGWVTLQRALSTYFTRWAFQHPQPQDFFAIVNEVSGRDLTWFFDQVHRSADVFDYGVDVFRSEPLDAKDVSGGAAGAGSADAKGRQTYRTTVVARRYGEGRFPVEIKVSFDDNEEVRWMWDGRERWKLFEVDKPARGRRAEVDPERVLLLDINSTNNSAVLDPAGPQAARKWSLVWLIWLQDHLLTHGFFI